VKIYLPQVAASLSRWCGEPSRIEAARDILVVEDDSLVRTFVVSQIQSLGYATLAAVNATEAMLVIDSPQEIDLLFTDMIMPGSMNGASSPTRRCCAGRVENIVHLRLFQRRHHPSRPSRCRRVAARQAVSQVGSCADDTNRACCLTKAGR